MKQTTKHPIVLSMLLFGLAAVLSSSTEAGPYRDAVLADSPLAYWGLGETDPSQTAVNIGLLSNIADGPYTAGAMLGQPTLVLGEGDGSFLTSGPAERMTTAPFEKFSDVLGFGGTGFSVEFWTAFTSVQAGFANLVGDGEAGGDFNLMVYAGNGGFIRPHLPFVVPRKYWEMYDADAIPLAGNPTLPADAPADLIAYSIYEFQIQTGIQYQPHPALAIDGQDLRTVRERRDDVGVRAVHELQIPIRGRREILELDR